MSEDPKREVLRHAVATVAFRGRIAISDAPESFAEFRVAQDTRTPGELLAHIGDLIVGSHHLLQGRFVTLNSGPLQWNDEVKRFFAEVRELDRFLATDAPLAYPVEKFIQGPIGDALTHVGQIVLLRRLAGAPIRPESYFHAEIGPGRF